MDNSMAAHIGRRLGTIWTGSEYKFVNARGDVLGSTKASDYFLLIIRHYPHTYDFNWRKGVAVYTFPDGSVIIRDGRGWYIKDDSQ